MISIRERLEVVEGDITQLTVDAIVNAANASLLGGGGVDGAIHRAAGTGLLDECRELGGCPTGDVRVTAGYRLKARFVMHAVGPVWRGGCHDEDALLRRCYERALEEASARNLGSIAFPAISTGVYRFPPERAAKIAVDTVRCHLLESAVPERVVFCCFDPKTAKIYTDTIGEMLNG